MFNKEKANFGGIAEDIFVSSIVQKTYIDFMESGTKAAASSGGAFDITSAAEEKEVIFNKPFVYLIRKKGSNNIYFIGIVNTPIEYDETKDVCEG
jgi:serine protease inhibitor